MKRWNRVLVLALVAGLATGCASIPTSSAVFAGGTEIVADSAVGFIAQGPQRGQGPEDLVRGFLLATQSGPTMPSTFNAAREYLTNGATLDWRPGAGVWVLDGVPALEVTQDDGDPTRSVVTAFGRAVGEVNGEGEFTEFRFPKQIASEFHLAYDGENWRIYELDDGVMLPAQIFAAAYRYTHLYHPTPDLANWVPDIRWFPQQTWRANVVNAVLAGPPEFLIDAVLPGIPDRAAVNLEAVAVRADGIVEVHLGGYLRDQDPLTISLFAAQLANAFTDGNSAYSVVLVDSQGIVPVIDIVQPAMPETIGAAMAISENRIYRIAGREMVPVIPELNLANMDLTALAIAPDPSGAIVVRNGRTELWGLSPDPAPPFHRLTSPERALLAPPGQAILDPPGDIALDPAELETADDPLTDLGDESLPEDSVLLTPEDIVPTPPDEHTLLFVGENLVPPSIDRFGLVWTAERHGQLKVIDTEGNAANVSAPWLEESLIETLTVAPDGVRIALVTRESDGTRLLVAGIVRDDIGVPIGLDYPIEVGASVREITSVAWQDGAVLAVIGRRAAVAGVYLVGVGGMNAPGGLPRMIPGITDPVELTASVGTGNILGIDAEMALHLREATSLWPIVGKAVELVAYPG